MTEGGGPGACAASYPYGHTVKVILSPETHWELTALSGTGSAETHCTIGTGSCEFAIEAASAVNATSTLNRSRSRSTRPASSPANNAKT